MREEGTRNSTKAKPLDLPVSGSNDMSLTNKRKGA